MTPIEAQSKNEIEQLTSRLADWFMLNPEYLPLIGQYIADGANEGQVVDGLAMVGMERVSELVAHRKSEMKKGWKF